MQLPPNTFGIVFVLLVESELAKWTLITLCSTVAHEVGLKVFTFSGERNISANWDYLWCAVEHDRLVGIGSWLKCVSSWQQSPGLMGLTSARQRGS